MLDSTDIEILMVIQNDPLATISSIANTIGMSISGTKTRIDKLEEQKAFDQIHADLNLDALELEIYDFLFKVDNKESLDLLEQQFCYHHPYILYRGRCYGHFSGLYLQYRAPKNSLAKIELTAKKLQDKGVISNFAYLARDTDEKAVRIKSAIDCWDQNKKKWLFDWKAWTKGFKENRKKDFANFAATPKKSILHNLSELDIQVLAELSMDARRKNVEIIRNLQLEEESGVAQKISRKVSYLKDKAISDYRVFLKWASFDLYQTILIHADCEKEEAVSLKYHLANNQKEENNDYANFPFESLYFLTEEGFVWYIRAPPSHLSNLMDFLWEFYPQHNLYWIDYRHSEVYGLWAETFDSNKQKWKTDDGFLIENVLQKL